MSPEDNGLGNFGVFIVSGKIMAECLVKFLSDDNSSHQMMIATAPIV